MNENKMIGIIKWYKEQKGYGYIIGADEETYFFEIINCINLNETFKQNDKVLFVPNFTNMYFVTNVEKMKISR